MSRFIDQVRYELGELPERIPTDKPFLSVEPQEKDMPVSLPVDGLTQRHAEVVRYMREGLHDMAAFLVFNEIPTNYYLEVTNDIRVPRIVPGFHRTARYTTATKHWRLSDVSNLWLEEVSQGESAVAGELLLNTDGLVERTLSLNVPQDTQGRYPAVTVRRPATDVEIVPRYLIDSSASVEDQEVVRAYQSVFLTMLGQPSVF